MAEERMSWENLVVLARNPDADTESRFRAYETLLQAMDWRNVRNDVLRLLDLREIRADLYGLHPADRERSVKLYERYCPYREDKEFCAP